MKTITFLISIVAWISFFSLKAQDWNQLKKIAANSEDRTEYSYFGCSVSISGNFAIVGAYGYNNSKGAAYIYEYDGTYWSRVQKILASDAYINDHFGKSVSILNDYAIIGATYGEGQSNSSGAAYIFHNDGSSWNQIQKIMALDGVNYDNFGESVAIDTNFAIIGACFGELDVEGNNPIDNAGSAYIFKKNGDTLEYVQKFVATDRITNARFGNSVSLSGDYAFVGAYFEGAVYIYHNNNGTWEHSQKLISPLESNETYFGNSVSISGDFALISAPREDVIINETTLDKAGCVYAYYNNEGDWQQIQKIVSSDLYSEDWFGTSVSISGNIAIIGAHCEDEDADGENTVTYAGSAYIFHYNEEKWEQINKIVASDRSNSDFFGNNVAISDSFAFIGVDNENHDENGINSINCAGSAYIFTNKSISVLNPPTLISPTNGAIDQPTSVTFSWNPIVDAFYYHLQVDDNNDFTSPVYDLDKIFGDSKNVENLNSGTSYYWRLNATNGGGASSWSEIRNFMTTPEAEPIVDPEVDAADYVGGSNPFFHFDHIEGNYYDLYITFYNKGTCDTITIIEENVQIGFIIDIVLDYPTEGGIGGLKPSGSDEIAGLYNIELANCGVSVNGDWSVYPASSSALNSKLYNIEQIRTYPNPIDNILYFQGIDDENSIVSILSVDGKLLKQITKKGINQIDLNDIQKGIYILKISNSKLVYSKQIIKQ